MYYAYPWSKDCPYCNPRCPHGYPATTGPHNAPYWHWLPYTTAGTTTTTTVTSFTNTPTDNEKDKAAK